MSSPPPPDPARVAYHEAGHVVACVKLGFPFSQVAMVHGQPGELGGFVEHAHFTPPFWPAAEVKRYWRRAIKMMMAGYAAEGLFLGQAWIDLEHPQSDWFCAKDLAHFCGDDAEAVLMEGLRSVERLIAAHWPSVQAVAEALLERQTLTREEAIKAIRSAARAV
jgi:ATP-dependent Zn protease